MRMRNTCLVFLASIAYMNCAYSINACTIDTSKSSDGYDIKKVSVKPIPWLPSLPSNYFIGNIFLDCSVHASNEASSIKVEDSSIYVPLYGIITQQGSGGGVYQSSGQHPTWDNGSEKDKILPGYSVSYTWIHPAGGFKRPSSVSAVVTANLVVKCNDGEKIFSVANTIACGDPGALYRRVCDSAKSPDPNFWDPGVSGYVEAISDDPNSVVGVNSEWQATRNLLNSQKLPRKLFGFANTISGKPECDDTFTAYAYEKNNQNRVSQIYGSYLPKYDPTHWTDYKNPRPGLDNIGLADNLYIQYKGKDYFEIHSESDISIFDTHGIEKKNSSGKNDLAEQNYYIEWILGVKPSKKQKPSDPYIPLWAYIVDTQRKCGKESNDPCYIKYDIRAFDQVRINLR